MSVIAAGMVALIDALILMTMGIREKRNNDKYTKAIPIRISVNGIRGKSTATRLITAILTESGYKTVGKTTGTAARMLVWNEEDERIIKRKPRGVSIQEQLRVIKEAYMLGAEALVCECMAVDPNLQIVYTHKMLHPNGGGVTVIVNVIEDHLDQMGPTTTEIAMAFAETIPYHGIAIVPNCEFTDYFRTVAKKRGTKVYVIDDTLIPPKYLKMFDYKLFAHNCAVALTTAKALGIPAGQAFHAMLRAHPDPGSLRMHELGHGTVFVNGFAANEPSSSLDIWDVVKESGYDYSNPIVVMNCRPDRVDRTKQFVRDFFPYIPNCKLLIIGERTSDCVRAYKEGKLPNVEEFRCIEGKDIAPIREWLLERMENRIVYGVGNIHGIGGDFMQFLFHAYEKEEKVNA